MKALRATIRLDLKLQAKNKLYAIGLGVAVLMGFALRYLFSVNALPSAIPGFYLLGVGGTTFMFAASMVLLERSEGTLEALRVSMLRVSDYVHSKLVTLVGFSILESLVVWGIASRGVAVNYLWLFLGLFVLGSFYLYLGLGLVAPFRSVTKFLLPTGTLAAMVTQLPALSLLDIGPTYLWWAVPTSAPLLLMRAAFEPLSSTQWVYALSMSLISLLAARWFCLRRCSRELGLSCGRSR